MITTSEITENNRYDKVTERPTMISKIEEPPRQEPVPELTERELLSQNYFNMFKNNQVQTNYRDYYYEDYSLDYIFYNIMLNSYGPFFAHPETLTIDEIGVCYSDHTEALDNEYFDDIKNDGYEVVECIHKFNYCKDDACGIEEDQRSYDYTFNLIVGYIKVNNEWKILYDEPTGDNDLFIQSQGDIDRYLSLKNS